MREFSSRTPYSALEPSGDVAVIIADMYWWLVGAAFLIWLIFIVLEIYVVLGRPGPHDEQKTSLFVIGLGTLFPVVVITISVYFSLRPLPHILRAPPPDALKIEVHGLQWWWRVIYLENDKRVELANEIWLPVNRPVSFILKSPDVIHSFWVPTLGGKMDMIPGRTTTLTLTPTKTGSFMGICAEYCGASHALMRLHVKVVEETIFRKWLDNQGSAITKSHHPGEKAFIANGCISCHSVRGVSEIGKIAPDLTHLGSRMKLGAGVFNLNRTNLKKFIRHVHAVKPEAKMPHYQTMNENEIKNVAEWLEGLK